jgi:hypothetical protein
MSFSILANSIQSNYTFGEDHHTFEFQAPIFGIIEQGIRVAKEDVLLQLD